MSGRDLPADPPYLIFHAPKLPATNILDLAVDALDADERAKASRFRSAHDRRRFIWRRYLRRHVLAEALGTTPGDLVFATVCPRCGSGAHGKPYLPHAPHLHFSAAQSADPTAIAIGPEAFGIDIQASSAELRDVELFTPDEQAVVGGARFNADRRRAVLWSRKEAYLKALGLGLSIEPALVDARAAGFADGVFGRIEATGQAPWSTASWTLPDTVIAIAIARPSSVNIAEIAGAVDPQTGRLMVREVKARGHEGETGMIYASSGANGGADLSRGR